MTADLFGALQERKQLQAAGRALASLIKAFYDGLVVEEIPGDLIIPLLTAFTSTLATQLICRAKPPSEEIPKDA